MAVTDAEYADWLASDRKRRCVLVEADAHTGSAVETFYLSNLAYVSGPGQTPAHTPYDDLIAMIPEFTTNIDGDFSLGEVEIVNTGELDDWLTYSWSGQPLKVYFGDPAWDRDDFRLILDGICGGIRASGRARLELTLQDKRALFDVPVQTSLLADNQPIPICLGEIFNAEPVLTDAANLVYTVHDSDTFGNLTSINAVRDNGVALALTTGYTVDLASSPNTITLVNAPEGRITFDATGPKPTTADMCDALASLVTADIDSTNLSAYPDTATLGLYLREQISIARALELVLRTSGGTHRFNRAGDFQIFRLDLPSGAADAELTADDIVQFGIAVISHEPPQARVLVGYQKNWTPQQELAASVSAANKKLYAEPHQIVTADNAIAAKFPNAGTPPVVDSLYADEADAQAEADRRAAIRADKRFVYGIDGFATPLSLIVGKVIDLTHPRFGFENGELTRLVALRETPTTGRVDVELWR